MNSDRLKAHFILIDGRIMRYNDLIRSTKFNFARVDENMVVDGKMTETEYANFVALMYGGEDYVKLEKIANIIAKRAKAFLDCEKAYQIRSQK